MKAPLAAASPLLIALVWVAALLVDPGPLAPGSVLLIGIGLLGSSVVSVVGMVVAGGRWARRLGVAVIVFASAIGVARPLDWIWVVALGISGVALVALFTGPMSSSIRRRPAAAGPPTRAVLIPVILVAFPAPLGLAAWDDPMTVTLIIGITAPVAALWYSRVLPGGLIAVRVAWPGLAVALSVAQDPAPALVSVLGGLVVASLAWHPDSKHAFHPPVETGTTYPIPPELAPREVLDAAEVDERGNPRS